MENKRKEQLFLFACITLLCGSSLVLERGDMNGKNQQQKHLLMGFLISSHSLQQPHEILCMFFILRRPHAIFFQLLCASVNPTNLLISLKNLHKILIGINKTLCFIASRIIIFLSFILSLTEEKKSITCLHSRNIGSLKCCCVLCYEGFLMITFSKKKKVH